jgi:hypothetical protein
VKKQKFLDVIALAEHVIDFEETKGFGCKRY